MTSIAQQRGMSFAHGVWVGGLTVIAAMSILVMVASAEEWSLQINTASTHFGAEGMNQHNGGFGLQRDDRSGDRVTYYAAGTLINSMNDRSWYAGGGHRYRIMRAPFDAHVGYFAGAITYPSSGYPVLPAVVPMLELGSSNWSLAGVYIPKVTRDGVPAILFQLRVKVN